VSEMPTKGQPYLTRQPVEPPGEQQPPPASDDTGGVAYVWQAYPSVRIATIILCLAIAAAIVWLTVFRSNGESATAEPGGGPVETTRADLVTLSQRLGQPVYWAGVRSGTELEATVTTSNYTYVRYLTPGAQIGDTSPQFLTVATYPATDALSNLRAYANHEHATITHISDGGIAVPVPGAPTSVYFAVRRSNYQVEVYDPKKGTALDLIKAGTIEPVPGGVRASGPKPQGALGG
jgi:hypothetical protein